MTELALIGAFETQEEAEEACELLRDAGFSPVVIPTNHMIEVHVPEDTAYSAVQVLAGPADERPPEAVDTRQCPECSGFETRKLPPYAFYATVLVIAAAAVLILQELPGGVPVVLVFGWIAILWLNRWSGKVRCIRCGWTFEG